MCILKHMHPALGIQLIGTYLNSGPTDFQYIVPPPRPTRCKLTSYDVPLFAGHMYQHGDGRIKESHRVLRTLDHAGPEEQEKRELSLASESGWKSFEGLVSIHMRLLITFKSSNFMMVLY